MGVEKGKNITAEIDIEMVARRGRGHGGGGKSEHHEEPQFFRVF
jgi:hypothetical protein